MNFAMPALDLAKGLWRLRRILWSRYNCLKAIRADEARQIERESGWEKPPRNASGLSNILPAATDLFRLAFDLIRERTRVINFPQRFANRRGIDRNRARYLIIVKVIEDK